MALFFGVKRGLLLVWFWVLESLRKGTEVGGLPGM